MKEEKTQSVMHLLEVSFLAMGKFFEGYKPLYPELCFYCPIAEEFLNPPLKPSTKMENDRALHGSGVTVHHMIKGVDFLLCQAMLVV